ncbi:MAG: DUF3786 domain-containing protein [Desulfobacteraceae bacterium]|jgi:hypothetical protein
MGQLNTTMDIFKLLPKTNCRKCNAPTCLAFAAAVFQGKRQLTDCPYVDNSDNLSIGKSAALVREEEMLEKLNQLKAQVTQLDLVRRAEVIGGQFNEDKLVIRILGKNFAVDQNGRLITDIHVNPWIATPVFDYLLNAKGSLPTGEWVSFRELKNGQSWYSFFTRRCEAVLKRVADTYPELFEDMIHLFNARQVDNLYDADISVVLTPLPKVPILICYLKPEDGLDSNLHFYLDETIEENLSIQSIYTLGVGLAAMFEKIALRHGVIITS